MRRWRRQDRDLADGLQLIRQYPGYLITGNCGHWNATHIRSLTVLGPARTLGQLDRLLGDDAARRPAWTLAGLSVTLRHAGGPR